MSGKGSRMRRVEATSAAKELAYANKGDISKRVNPFDNERQARIFDKYYLQWCAQYQANELYWKDLELAYGYSR